MYSPSRRLPPRSSVIYSENSNVGREVALRRWHRAGEAAARARRLANGSSVAYVSSMAHAKLQSLLPSHAGAVSLMTRVALLERIQMGARTQSCRSHDQGGAASAAREGGFARAALHAANNVSCSFGASSGEAPKDPVAAERTGLNLKARGRLDPGLALSASNELLLHVT